MSKSEAKVGATMNLRKQALTLNTMKVVTHGVDLEMERDDARRGEKLQM